MLTEVNTYWANIYVGLKSGYDGDTLCSNHAEQIIREYVNKNKTCVTITKTKFMYVNGEEEGLILGMINYPRFPSEEKELRTKALLMAEFLKNAFNQQRVTVVFPDKTVMIGEIK